MPMSCRISGSRIGDAAQSGAEMAWTRKLRRLGVEPVPEAELPPDGEVQAAADAVSSPLSNARSVAVSRRLQDRCALLPDANQTIALCVCEAIEHQTALLQLQVAGWLLQARRHEHRRRPLQLARATQASSPQETRSLHNQCCTSSAPFCGTQSSKRGATTPCITRKLEGGCRRHPHAITA